MTRIAFENKITMGNLLTAAGMVITLAIAWADVQARQAELDRKSEELSAQADKMENRIDGSDNRIRALEQTAATSTARYESLAQSMGEVKAELRQTNDLLRQVLQEGRSQ